MTTKRDSQRYSRQGLSAKALRLIIGNLFRAGSLMFVLMAAVISVSGQVPEDFGYNRLQALGPRPLLVILTQFDGYPAFEGNATSYFRNLAFNTFAPASNPSLTAYYLENSNSRFYWLPAGVGVVGPYQFRAEDVGQDNNGQLTRISLALEAAANDGFDFSQFDANGDGVVTNSELEILIVDNLTGNGFERSASTRWSDPKCFAIDDGKRTLLCLKASLVGQSASFMSMAHELLHSLGISAKSDIYGSNDNSQGYTTMDATIYSELEDRRTYHLDPFHKVQLGWVEPKLYSMFVPHDEILGAANLIQDDQPVILYNPGDLHEFFMLEYRTSAAPGGSGYDVNVLSNGLVIWQVKVDDDKEPVPVPSLTGSASMDPAVFILGAPSLLRGHGTAFPAGNTDQIIPYPLRWLENPTGNSGVKIKVGRTRDNGAKLEVGWGDFPPPPLPVTVKIVYYSDSRFAGAVGQFDDSGNHQTLSTFYPGNIAWTNVVSDAAGIFYYDRRTGAAMLGGVDATGHHTVLKTFPQGYFGTGWTHIVSHRGYLFFYNSLYGSAAIGTISPNGFRQYKQYAAFSFGLGWTHIVSTANGLFFYSQANGMGAVGTWQISYSSPCDGCLQTVGDVSFKQLSGYQPGSFSTGWTSIAGTNNGVLFYRKSDGLQVMTDLDSSGRFTTRSNSLQYLKSGYTAIVAAGDDILLYNTATGDAALAAILKASPLVLPRSVGSLSIRKEFPAFFSPGWSQLVATADPSF